MFPPNLYRLLMEPGVGFFHVFNRCYMFIKFQTSPSFPAVLYTIIWGKIKYYLDFLARKLDKFVNFVLFD